MAGRRAGRPSRGRRRRRRQSRRTEFVDAPPSDSRVDATRALIRNDVLWAWKGPSLLVVSAAGDAGRPGSLTGFYFREARFLSTVRLEIDGQSLWLCEAAAIAPDQLQFVYTYPEVAVYEGGGSGQAGDEEPRNRKGIPQRGIDATLTYRVAIDHLSATAVVGNRTKAALTFELSWILEADFADIQEAQ